MVIIINDILAPIATDAVLDGHSQVHHDSSPGAFLHDAHAAIITPPRTVHPRGVLLRHPSLSGTQNLCHYLAFPSPPQTSFKAGMSSNILDVFLNIEAKRVLRKVEYNRQEAWLLDTSRDNTCQM
ncbi:hypothetical protein N656DRAFT_435167 [Canariomyces notabilis]|uniref:Uncharacterized protein n=1 Tax=Canariomyces notabilis TaxID=2074819 RepID=A0AAN6QDM7_9PEZI|nr:hypothetical protein N656DRAFT_435167 [Canariomyces arenarius]